MGLEKFLRFFDHKAYVTDAKETLVFGVKSRIEVLERFKKDSYLRYFSLTDNFGPCLSYNYLFILPPKS